MIDLGDVINGNVATILGYIKNNTDSLLLQVDYFTDDPDVMIEDLPRVLEPFESDKVTVVYSPDKDRDTDLSTSITLVAKKSEVRQ